MDTVNEWVLGNLVQIIITLMVGVAYVVLDRISSPRIARGIVQSRLKLRTAAKATRTARLIAAVVGVLILTLVWGIDLGPVLIFGTTILTLLGVAMFASWSLLSNVTAYFVLLMHPSFRRGTYIRVIDADNYVEGRISELGLFNTRIVTDGRSVIVYPNNLLLGRPVLVNPRDRLNEIGKLPPADRKEARSFTRRAR